jgi:hypothetical protein
VLPVLNKEAVEFAMKAAMALNCEIATDTKFDRKKKTGNADFFRFSADFDFDPAVFADRLVKLRNLICLTDAYGRRLFPR